MVAMDECKTIMEREGAKELPRRWHVIGRPHIGDETWTYAMRCPGGVLVRTSTDHTPGWSPGAPVQAPDRDISIVFVPSASLADFGVDEQSECTKQDDHMREELAAQEREQIKAYEALVRMHEAAWPRTHTPRTKQDDCAVVDARPAARRERLVAVLVPILVLVAFCAGFWLTQ